MRIAHFDVTSGAAGDMLLAALLDAGAPIGAIRAALGACGLAGEVDLVLADRVAGGFRVAHLEVTLAADARARQVPDVLRAIDASGLTARVRDSARGTIERIAEVEARLHGRPVSELHLHELSSADTLADVVGFWVAIEALGIETISATPINLGGGLVTFSHGRFGVPAPATAELLRGVPVFGAAEAAIDLSTAVSQFGPMPPMTVDRIGYAVGSRPTEPPQILRCYVGSA
jgi:uncharacterized protein (DUF111 family)